MRKCTYILAAAALAGVVLGTLGGCGGPPSESERQALEKQEREVREIQKEEIRRSQQ